MYCIKAEGYAQCVIQSGVMLHNIPMLHCVLRRICRGAVSCVVYSMLSPNDIKQATYLLEENLGVHEQHIIHDAASHSGISVSRP